MSHFANKKVDVIDCLTPTFMDPKEFLNSATIKKHVENEEAYDKSRIEVLGALLKQAKKNVSHK